MESRGVFMQRLRALISDKVAVCLLVLAIGGSVS
jgi:hypothetical protein